MIAMLKFSFESYKLPSPPSGCAQCETLSVMNLQPVSKPNSSVSVAALRTAEGNTYFQFDCTGLPVPIISL